MESIISKYSTFFLYNFVSLNEIRIIKACQKDPDPQHWALYKLCSSPNEPFSGLNITLINTRFAFTQSVVIFKKRHF